MLLEAADPLREPPSRASATNIIADRKRAAWEAALQADGHGFRLVQRAAA
jgi:hypothetical protein